MSSEASEDTEDTLKPVSEGAETQADLTDEQKQILVQKGLLFEQLYQSERFQLFFAVNFDLMKDEDTQEFFLVEVPHEVAAKRQMQAIKQMQKEAQADIAVPSTEEVVKFNK